MSFLFSGVVFAKTIKIGIIDFPPHVNFIQNIEKDKAYKYVNRVLKGMYEKVQFVKLSQEKGLIELDNGTLDLLFPLKIENNELKHLTKPLFNLLPGLCFKKENFIPILSALHQLKGLSIGILSGTPILSLVKNAGANFQTLDHNASLSQGIALLLAGKYKAFYHPNPMEVYHYNNPLSKKIVCSRFLGYPSAIHIAVKKNMNNEEFSMIDKAFSHALEINSYEQYYWQKK
jgi:ABC-type amino acid transport substrate-binding protein